MPRPKTDLEPYYTLITEAYQGRKSIKDIQLALSPHISVSRQTLYNYIKSCNLSLHQTRTRTTDQLRERLEELFWSYGLNDVQLLQRLKEEGCDLSKRRLVQLRIGLGLLRRMDTEQVQAAQEEVRHFFETEHCQENQVYTLGMVNLYAHMRRRHFNLARHPLWRTYSEFHSAEIELRRNQAYRRIHGFTCPGPNYYWGVDGYLKLSHYGFEIYAGLSSLFSSFLT